MSLRALLLLAATPLYAQFSQFAATDDGSQVYFISSLAFDNLPAAPSGSSMLYRIGPDGVSYVAGIGYTSISGPQVSGDGSVTGFTYVGDCHVKCDSETQIQYAQQSKPLGPGNLQLSRNGRWALVSTLDPVAPSATLIDPVTNFAAQIPQPRITGFRTLASDGTVLVQNGLWNQGQVTAIPFPIGLTYNPLALSDNAAVIVSYASVTGPAASSTGQLVATNVATGKPATLYRWTSTTFATFMAMSNDGSRALYRVTPLASAAGTAYVADTSTGQSTPIDLPTGELVVDGTLSGDGNIAILVTSLGRIVKVTLATGAIEPLIPPTPYIMNVFGEVPIGSVVHFQTTYPGSAADWTGQILLGGKPLPVLGVKPGIVDVQIPWEQPAGMQQLQIGLQYGSPFQQSQTIYVTPIVPFFESLDPGQSAIFPFKIIKGDWSGYQTTQPKAGDIIYMYMTGLGPVVNPVQTGMPASLTTPDSTRNTLACTFTPQTTPAQTLFAGLAPGSIGIYQVAFRMPADPDTQTLNGMQCSIGATSFGFTVGFGGVAVGTIFGPVSLP